MTVLTGILGLLGRFAGQVLNTTLGWAPLLLFGKVPQKRQALLLVIVFGSLIWVALVVGVILPQVGLLLVAALPLPGFIDETWVRVAMLAGAVATPFLIGIAAAVASTGQRDRGPGGPLIAGLRGYPFALVLTVMLGLLAAVAIVRKVRTLARRWEDAHIPIMVKPGEYEAVLAEVEQTLDLARLDVSPRDAGALLAGPPRMLDKIAGRGLGDLVPDRMMILAGDGIEVLVYPSDLAISGTRERVARARAALASRVSEAPAYLTMTAEAQEIEDVLSAIRDDSQRHSAADTLGRLRELDSRLASLAVPYDEWQILYRLRLQLERDARREMDADDGDDFLDLPSGHGGLLPVRLAIGLGGAALIALDVALVLASRRSAQRD